jgi:hypothetical protein
MEITITKHAIKRYKDRFKKSALTNEQAKEKLSKLLDESQYYNGEIIKRGCHNKEMIFKKKGRYIFLIQNDKLITVMNTALFSENK